MKKEPIALATKLLVKAQGTKFDAEAAALTGRAYRLLAEALNAYEDTAASAGAARKRERRQLRDRRSPLGSQAPSVPWARRLEDLRRPRPNGPVLISTADASKRRSAPPASDPCRKGRPGRLTQSVATGSFGSH
jgi:hypothetical protein